MLVKEVVLQMYKSVWKVWKPFSVVECPSSEVCSQSKYKGALPSVTVAYIFSPSVRIVRNYEAFCPRNITFDH